MNDRLGHMAGDAALERVSAVLMAAKRRVDVAARMGGEEFALIVPASGEEAARVLAERLRAELRTRLRRRPRPAHGLLRRGRVPRQRHHARPRSSRPRTARSTGPRRRGGTVRWWPDRRRRRRRSAEAPAPPGRRCYGARERRRREHHGAESRTSREDLVAEGRRTDESEQLMEAARVSTEGAGTAPRGTSPRPTRRTRPRHPRATGSSTSRRWPTGSIASSRPAAGTSPPRASPSVAASRPDPARLDAAIDALSRPGRLTDAEARVAEMAPQLGVILARALEDGGLARGPRPGGSPGGGGFGARGAGTAGARPAGRPDAHGHARGRRRRLGARPRARPWPP
ncbi:MAG: diguanylate cyclase [Thermoleophilaceae bacterium]